MSDPPVRIRPYHSRDAEETLRICHRAIRLTAATRYGPDEIEAWLPAWDVASWTRRLINQEKGGADAYVAEMSGRIAGFGSIITKPQTAEIDLLYVDPDFSRRGVATALTQHLLLQGRDSGASTCSVEASNILRPLLERLGFELVRTQRVRRRGVDLENHVMCADCRSA